MTKSLLGREVEQKAGAFFCRHVYKTKTKYQLGCRGGMHEGELRPLRPPPRHSCLRAAVAQLGNAQAWKLTREG